MVNAPHGNDNTRPADNNNNNNAGAVNNNNALPPIIPQALPGGHPGLERRIIYQIPEGQRITPEQWCNEIPEGGRTYPGFRTEHGADRAVLTLREWRHQVWTNYNDPNQTKMNFYMLGMREIPWFFLTRADITEMKFENNHITDIPPEICNVNAIQILDFWINRIRSIPDGLRGLPNLQRLFLNGDSFVYLIGNEAYTRMEMAGQIQGFGDTYVTHNGLGAFCDAVLAEAHRRGAAFVEETFGDIKNEADDPPE